MIIIMGLGNPGKQYKNTRHNAGFMVLDEFIKRNNFAAFKLSKKFSALISEGILNDKKVILAKPETFMNESGKTAKALAAAYKSSVQNILVIHDDLDLPLGKIKIVKNRGAAGHKGVTSIIKTLGNKNLIRFRVGIANEKSKTNNAEKFVLEKFSEEENKILKEILQKTTSAIEMYLKEGLEKTMSEYNN